ncbi:hypothetical protein BCR34DRAFT_486300 [Clohesyomyces aquaticus]|uniref:Cytochrome c oxidase polypeptide VIIA n=1 Tax=Clohesyomyces aquaticus TaxID=1231657 RepID=A0A1Y1ZJR5_9PLEO|nr:hypothetical protein BCR34DRAFT_486300 [Clohesyomyces aquaticus]
MPVRRALHVRCSLVGLRDRRGDSRRRRADRSSSLRRSSCASRRYQLLPLSTQQNNSAGASWVGKLVLKVSECLSSSCIAASAVASAQPRPRRSILGTRSHGGSFRTFTPPPATSTSLVPPSRTASPPHPRPRTRAPQHALSPSPSTPAYTMAIKPITGMLRRAVVLDLSVGIGIGVAGGYAWWYGYHVPNVRHRDAFYQKIEDDRAAKMGLAEK